MKKLKFIIFIKIFILSYYCISEAAQFKKMSETIKQYGTNNIKPQQITPKLTPTHIDYSNATSAHIDQTSLDPCSFPAALQSGDFLIEATEPGENIGDPVCVQVCYEALGESLAEGSGFQGLSGNGAASFNSSCTPFFANLSEPAKIVRNSTTIFHDGPRSTAAPFSVTNCGGTFPAVIGDNISIQLGTFSAVKQGTGVGEARAEARSRMRLEFRTTNECVNSFASLAVPTMTEWGIIIFILLTGIGAVYYLRRQRKS